MLAWRWMSSAPTKRRSAISRNARSISSRSMIFSSNRSRNRKLSIIYRNPAIFCQRARAGNGGGMCRSRTRRRSFGALRRHPYAGLSFWRTERAQAVEFKCPSSSDAPQKRARGTIRGIRPAAANAAGQRQGHQPCHLPLKSGSTEIRYAR